MDLKLLDCSLALLLMLTLAGCSAWTDARVEQATVASIDNGLTSGMALADFRRQFPDATRVGGDEVSGDWLVSAQQVCFVCSSAAGFSRSRDIYARIVHFEQGVLTSIKPLPQEQSRD